jgi:hypothetical protein
METHWDCGINFLECTDRGGSLVCPQCLMAILMPPQKSTIKPEDVQSRLARYVFSCERPKIDAAKSQEKRQEEARRGQLFWVTASGFLKLREIPGGIRSELTARTPETTFRMSPATK